jgi:glycosyltransferase involved in cell wall biosynthesis
MKLAYLTSQYPATSHTFIRREIAALRDRGVELATYSIRAPAAAELTAEEDRREAASTYTVLRRGLNEFAAAHASALLRRPIRYLRTLRLALGHRPPGVRALLLALAHFGESILLARQLRRDDITHLHNHFANSAATVGMLASRHIGIGWSFTMHGISETDYPAGLMLPDKIRAAWFVACVSWFGRAQAMRVVPPSHWPKLSVVRCGLELDRLPQRLRAEGGDLRIICVGRLSPEKGHAGLLKAFAELRRIHPHVRLILVGDGPDREELDGLADELGLRDSVSFLGRLAEQATLKEVAASDVLVLPSFMEGLPVVLMEAMAIGLPVIASRVAGIPELIVDEQNGLLFTPANWAELLRCLDRLTTSAHLREQLGQQGRQTVANEFDIRQSAAQLQDIFDRLHQGTPDPSRA